MSIMLKTCLNCEQEFQAELREHRRGNAKYCCRSCSAQHRVSNIPPPEPNLCCAQCDTEFYRNTSSKKQATHGFHFCSRACKDSAQRIGGIIEIQPPHYGDGNGIHDYRKRAFEHYPHECADCGYDKHVGVLEVHHIDESRDNNAIENLVILCRNCHRLRHLDFLDEFL